MTRKLDPKIKKWKDLKWWNTHHYRELTKFLKERRASGVSINPHESKVYEAFQLTPFDKVKVVILGPNPDPRAGSSDGLAYSELPHVTRSRSSLRSIISEYCSDLGMRKPHSYNLRPWAQNGVLLLNTALTCDTNRPRSHTRLGWERLAVEVIIQVSRQSKNPVVFILWGKRMQEYRPLIDETRHLVIATDAPGSPKRSRKGVPFTGSKPFSKANRFLGNNRKVDWKLI